MIIFLVSLVYRANIFRAVRPTWALEYNQPRHQMPPNPIKVPMEQV